VIAKYQPLYYLGNIVGKEFVYFSRYVHINIVRRIELTVTHLPVHLFLKSMSVFTELNEII
jgi:hypothetical protein